MPKTWDPDRTYVIADLHLFHENILTYDRIGQAYFTDSEQRFALLKQWWNETVSPDEDVIVLGDICFVKERLADWQTFHGNKYLVAGNHDEYSTWRYLETAGFRRVMPCVEFEGLVMTHFPIHPIEKQHYIGNVHGHLHGKTIEDPWYLSVCAEQIDYRPIKLRAILEHFSGLVTKEKS